MAARGLGVERVDAHRQGVRLSFSAQTRVDPMSLIRRAQEDPGRFRLEGETVFRVRMDLSDPAQRVQAVDDLLAELADEAAQPTR
jgi:transcription-repair coupling factor (superfamily II helicase)